MITVNNLTEGLIEDKDVKVEVPTGDIESGGNFFQLNIK